MAFLSLLVSLSVVACISLLSGSGSSVVSLGETTLDLPYPDISERQHPKLQSALAQLVAADSIGAASTYAQQSGIDLLDGHVRVVIEATPGEAQAAAAAANALGAKFESSYADWVQVVAPIAVLTTLADCPGVQFVRLPLTSVPAIASEGRGMINAPEWYSAGFTGVCRQRLRHKPVMDTLAS
jgi:hypothetical protein